MSLAARLASVRARIDAAAERAGRDPATVRLVTVTKAHPLERIEEAIAAGATLLGENRLEEAEWKIPALRSAPVQWHMIGHLQSRKARRVGRLFHLIHSLDHTKTLAILGQQRHADNPQEILLEVNLAHEAQKHGVPPDALRSLLDAALAEPGIRVRGLMTLAPATPDPETVRPVFAGLRELRDRLAAEYAGQCDLAELSMGMTGDFEVAVEEGATLVRVGTAIMGDRPRG